MVLPSASALPLLLEEAIREDTKPVHSERRSESRPGGAIPGRVFMSLCRGPSPPVRGSVETLDDLPGPLIPSKNIHLDDKTDDF